MALYCSRCGCGYRQINTVPGFPTGRAPGSVCGDRSGGINDEAPCTGVLEASEMTDQIRSRQMASMFEPQPDRVEIDDAGVRHWYGDNLVMWRRGESNTIEMIPAGTRILLDD